MKLKAFNGITQNPFRRVTKNHIKHCFFSYQLSYLPSKVHICPRPSISRKYALPRADNITDMKKPM